MKTSIMLVDGPLVGMIEEIPDGWPVPDAMKLRLDNKRHQYRVDKNSNTASYTGESEDFIPKAN